MTDDTLIQLEGTEPRFFSMIPHMVDDSDLSPHAVRLYLHLKRVAGEGNGECWQSVDTMAKHCRMGHSSVSNGKKALAAAGLIRITADHRGGRTYHTITIVNVWAANNAHMARPPEERKGKPPSPQGTGNETPSPPGTGPSPQGTGPSPGQPQRKTHEEEPLEEKPKDMGAVAPVHGLHWVLPSLLCAPTEPVPWQDKLGQHEDVTCPDCLAVLAKGEPSAHQQMFAVVAWVCQYDHRMISKDDRGKINQLVGKLGKLKPVPPTPTEVLRFGDFWISDDAPWQAKDGPARPDLIMSSWGKFRRWQYQVEQRAQGEESAQAHRTAAEKAQDKADRARGMELLKADEWLKLAKGHLKGQMTIQTFNTWIDPLQVCTINGSGITLWVQTQAQAEWLEHRLAARVLDGLGYATEGRITEVSYRVKETNDVPDLR